MKVKALAAVLVIVCTAWIFPKDQTWGNLKKIYFYDSVGQGDRVLDCLQSLDTDGLTRTEKREIADQLLRFGDSGFIKGNVTQAEAFYQKVLSISPEYWHVYNRLEKVNRARGGFLIRFGSVFRQLKMVLDDFKAAFMLANHALTILFYSVLVVFFIFSGVMIVKYFRLLANDLFLDSQGKISASKTGVAFLVMAWPLLILSGWMIYPFLILGLFWFYLDENERKTVKTALVIIGMVSLLYSFGRMMEANIQEEPFQKTWNVYNGHLYPSSDYRLFDDELKVIQAYSYYEHQDYTQAIDILNSTRENFKNKLKSLLLGNINFKLGEFSKSTEYYVDALRLDDHNPIALNNFTLALLKANNPDAFTSYAQRFPEIQTYKARSLEIREVPINQRELWKRVMTPSHSGANMGAFFLGVGRAFVKCPIGYYILLFILYVTLMPKAFPSLGESIYCSKCRKIIKEASVHRSFKLCSECHQLFSIKNIVFLEAKLLKEKELKEALRSKTIAWTLMSILIPGLSFNLNENNRSFFVSSLLVYLLAGFVIVGTLNFNRIFSTAPLFFNIIGIVAILVYIMVGIVSLMRDGNGF
ncbi:MAG: tetratricopeptide repeat protein [Candidatus Omnitrophota bacterium]